MAAVPYSNTDINRFWLQILGDNALIILNALSPDETEEAGRAAELAKRLDALALRANQNPTADQTARINREAYQAAQDLRTYILQILTSLLTRKLHIDLKPTVINLFVDETEKYLSMLNAFMQNKKPEYNPVLEEIFWLPVFSVQNRYIADNVGYFQIENRDKALRLATVLNEYRGHSLELHGMARIGTEDFPMAREHHIVVLDVLNGYYEFLKNLVALQQQKMQPGSISLLYLDRSRRMVCFYLMQAAVFLDMKAPDCDPYAKRISTV